MKDSRQKFPGRFKSFGQETSSKSVIYSKLFKSAGYLNFLTLSNICINILRMSFISSHLTRLLFSFKHITSYLRDVFVSVHTLCWISWFNLCAVIECSINFKHPHWGREIRLVHPVRSQLKARRTEIKLKARAYNKCFVILPTFPAVSIALWPQSLWDLFNQVKSITICQYFML